MSEEFVNRRGRKTKVNDEVAAAVPVDMTVQKPRSRIRLKFPAIRLPKVRISRRMMLIFAVALVVIGVIVLVGVDSVKRDYERQAAAMRRSILEAGKHIPSQDASALEVARQLRSGLTAPTTCRVTGLDVVSWYGPAKNARDDCVATARTYTELQTALRDMEAVSGYISTVGDALSAGLGAPSGGQYAIADDYVTSWAAAQEKIKHITPPPRVAQQHEALLRRVTSVLEAWQSMQQAMSNRSAEAFKSSEAKLQTAYTELRTSAVEIQATTTGLQSSITSLTR